MILIKLQISYTTESEFNKFMEKIKSYGLSDKIKRPETSPGEVTKAGNIIRWVELKEI